jgi:hypothetical protein
MKTPPALELPLLHACVAVAPAPAPRASGDKQYGQDSNLGANDGDGDGARPWTSAVAVEMGALAPALRAMWGLHSAVPNEDAAAASSASSASAMGVEKKKGNFYVTPVSCFECWSGWQDGQTEEEAVQAALRQEKRCVIALAAISISVE